MKALILDKDNEFCAWAKEVLVGYDVSYSSDFLVPKPTSWDLIFIDVTDPKGFGVLETLYAAKITAAKIALTTMSDEHLISGAMCLHADDFIRKPMSETVLKVRTDAVVSRVHSTYFRNAILEALPDLTFMVNKDAEIIYFKQNRTEMSRWSSEDAVIGMSLVQYFCSTIGVTFDKNIKYVLAHKKNMEFHYEVEIDGKTHWRSAILVYYENSEPKVICIVRDHTDLVNAYVRTEEQFTKICSLEPVARHLKNSASDLWMESSILESLVKTAQKKLAEGYILHV